VCNQETKTIDVIVGYGCRWAVIEISDSIHHIPVVLQASSFNSKPSTRFLHALIPTMLTVEFTGDSHVCQALVNEHMVVITWPTTWRITTVPLTGRYSFPTPATTPNEQASATPAHTELAGLVLALAQSDCRPTVYRSVLWTSPCWQMAREMLRRVPSQYSASLFVDQTRDTLDATLVNGTAVGRFVAPRCYCEESYSDCPYRDPEERVSCGCRSRSKNVDAVGSDRRVTRGGEREGVEGESTRATGEDVLAHAGSH